MIPLGFWDVAQVVEIAEKTDLWVYASHDVEEEKQVVSWGLRKKNMEKSDASFIFDTSKLKKNLL